MGSGRKRRNEGGDEELQAKRDILRENTAVQDFLHRTTRYAVGGTGEKCMGEQMPLLDLR